MTSRILQPKLLELIYESIEHVAERAYASGQQDQAAGKSLNPEDFKLSKASRLQLKTNLIKALEKR